MVTSPYRDRFEEASRRLLAARLPDDPGGQTTGIAAAVHYALDCGGKRIRPILVYSAAAAVGSDSPAALDNAAVAIELVHTYSLIHDDLPAMDDDDLRRGQLTIHKAFDEATAILVGDGMQVEAFSLIAVAPGISDSQKVEMMATLAAAAGFSGMVGGQYVDVAATGSELSLENLRAMHGMKTGALIRASLALGAIAAGASAAQRTALDIYGGHIGLAFQVVDDILDVEGDSATLGKTHGKDVAANKPTYVKMLGLEGARAEAGGLLQAALSALESFGPAADPLRQLANFIVARDR